MILYLTWQLFFYIACGSLNQDDINQLQRDGVYTLSLSNGESFELTLDEVVINSTDMPGWQVSSENGITVSLDLNITDDLEQEGVAREMGTKNQNLSKTKAFQGTDYIDVTLSHSDKINVAIEAFNDYIRGEILAQSITIQPNFEAEDELDINQEIIQVRLSKS